MAFRYVLTNRAGVALGELLNASNRSLAIGVNRNPTAAATIRLDDPLANVVLAGATMLKVYESGPPFAAPVLRFIGEVAGVQETGDQSGLGGSIVATFGGPMTRFQERLLGKGAAGWTSGSALSPRDRALMVADAVTAANAEGYTGVDLGTVTNVGSSSFYEAPPYKPAGEIITELVNLLDGPDYELVLQEPTSVAAGVRIATLRIAGVIGQARPAAVFEYGTGRRNVVGYERQVSYGIVNAGYGLAPSTDPAAPVVTSVDTTSVNLYGRREAVIPTDLPVADLRQRLVSEHVRIRRVPRQVIQFQPARDDASTPGRVPRFGSDFFLGDSVPFRAVQGEGTPSATTRVNASLRVYAVSWSVDDLGAATPTFTLTAE